MEKDDSALTARSKTSDQDEWIDDKLSRYSEDVQAELRDILSQIAKLEETHDLTGVSFSLLRELPLHQSAPAVLQAIVRHIEIKGELDSLIEIKVS